MAHRRKIAGKTFTGELEGFFETGTEGVIWNLIRDLAPGEHVESSYERDVAVEQGDFLEVFGEHGQTIWSGTVDMDYGYGWFPYPGNPIFGQQAVGGMWVHWVQKCDDPEAWATMFFKERRARLTKAVKKIPEPRIRSGNTDEVLPKMSDRDLQRVTPTLVKALTRYMDLKDEELCGLYRITPDMLTQWKNNPGSVVLSRAQADRIAALLGVCRILHYCNDTPGEKTKWLRKMNRHFGNQTPLQYLADGGIERVREMKRHLLRAEKRLIETYGEDRGY